MSLYALVIPAGAVGAIEALLLWTAGADPALTLLAGLVGGTLSAVAVAAAGRRQGAAGPNVAGPQHDPRKVYGFTAATDALNPPAWMDHTRRCLRHGLTEQTAAQVARIVLDLSGAAAVALADRSRVLAFVAAGSGRQRPDDPIGPEPGAQRDAPDCGARPGRNPLAPAVIAPLTVRDQVVGKLALYDRVQGPAAEELRRFGAGVAAILSMQLELAELEHQAAEGARYRLQALRSQINPHFLYNVLTAVIVKVRTDPEEARRLLLRLADFFRYAVRTDAQLVPFSAELAFVRTYLHLERARFGDDRFRVVYDVDPQILNVPIPVLTVQPLVENAVKHGVVPTGGRGTITLRAWTDFLSMRAYVEVRDDGVGMPLSRMRDVVRRQDRRRGIGLANIRQRLADLYGARASLTIDSRPGAGTRVRISVPVVRDLGAAPARPTRDVR